MTDMSQPVGRVEIRSGDDTGPASTSRSGSSLIVDALRSGNVRVRIRGRMVSEIVRRGAFDGIEKRANRIRVNRDHDCDTHRRQVVALASRRARRGWSLRSGSAQTDSVRRRLTLWPTRVAWTRARAFS